VLFLVSLLVVVAAVVVAVVTHGRLGLPHPREGGKPATQAGGGASSVARPTS
jgi:hypothetical protein